MSRSSEHLQKPRSRLAVSIVTTCRRCAARRRGCSTQQSFHQLPKWSTLESDVLLQVHLLTSHFCACSHEYSMSYQYHAMSNFFNRDNVGLQGFASFYRVSSLEERAHAQQLMDYQVSYICPTLHTTLVVLTTSNTMSRTCAEQLMRPRCEQASMMAMESLSFP